MWEGRSVFGVEVVEGEELGGEEADGGEAVGVGDAVGGEDPAGGGAEEGLKGWGRRSVDSGIDGGLEPEEAVEAAVGGEGMIDEGFEEGEGII